MNFRQAHSVARHLLHGMLHEMQPHQKQWIAGAAQEMLSARRRIRACVAGRSVKDRGIDERSRVAVQTGFGRAACALERGVVEQTGGRSPRADARAAWPVG
jgi:hypothetical protein